MYPVYCGRTQRAKSYPKLDGVETVPAWSRGSKPWNTLSPMLLGPFNVLEPVVRGTVTMYKQNVPFLLVRLDGSISPGYHVATTRVPPFQLDQTVDQGNGVSVHYQLVGEGTLQIATWQLFENYWQYGKIYQVDLVPSNGIPELSSKFWLRRAEGINSTIAKRHVLPKAKFGTPVCSFYHYGPMDYVYSRNQVYIPYYRELVSKTPAYQQLHTLHQTRPLLILGPDGLDYTDRVGQHYDHNTLISRELWERWRQDPGIIFGHELVLVGLLQNWFY